MRIIRHPTRRLIMRTSLRSLLVVTATVALATTLAACSTSDTATKPHPTASSPASPTDDLFSTPPADIETVVVPCTDGDAVVDLPNVDVTVPDCATVTVTASNSVVHLGTVEKLVVTGSINHVAGKQIASSQVDGNGNRITTDNATKQSGAGEDTVWEKR
jgi:hypothetical protein